MPNRIIRERALTSVTLDALSPEAERFFWRLILVADDFGRFEADPRIMLAKCFPLRVRRLTTERITRWWMELCNVQTVVSYRINDKLYGYFPAWNKHQTQRAKVSKYPDPPTSANICTQTQANVSEVLDVFEDVFEKEALLSSKGSTQPPSNGTRAANRDLRDHARSVLQWLNRKAGRTYPENGPNLKLIEARLRDGVQDWQLKAIVSLKTDEWKGNDKMHRYLRPKTLFNATNVANYLGELPPA